jgi:hypothetical protein
MTASTSLDLERTWAEALSYERFVAQSTENCALWQGVYRAARIPEWALERAGALSARRLLVIAEDWCGDASNAVPVIAKLADQVATLELRVIQRDEYLEVMDHYLTNGSRSIPIVIVLDADFRELGHWGPRPAELQAWVMENKERLPPPERYRQVRRWYAIDRGKAILTEVLELME